MQLEDLCFQAVCRIYYSQINNSGNIKDSMSLKCFVYQEHAIISQHSLYLSFLRLLYSQETLFYGGSMIFQ